MSYKKFVVNQEELFYQISSMNPRVSQLAHDAIKAKLYVRGWCMIEDLLDLFTTPDEVRPSGKIVLCSFEGNPIAVALQMCNGHRQFFVRGKFRRNGIGSHLNKILSNETAWNEKIYGRAGRKDCTAFFEKIGVKLEK